MHRITMPSPALVISMVALFVSLGGVSYGVATGSIDGREIKNNTVRSGDIKNNSVLSRDLRNNSVLSRDLRNNDIRSGDIRNSTIAGRDIRTGTITGSDIGANTVTGADVLESSLGLVPSANVANRAGSAAAVDRLQISGNSVRTASVGQTITLLTRGPLTLKLACTGTAVNPTADILIATSANGSAYSRGAGASGNADFGTADGDDSLTGGGANNAVNPSFIDDVYSATGADGTAISGSVYAGTNKNGAHCIGGATALG
jgi:hypothetical protein